MRGKLPGYLCPCRLIRCRDLLPGGEKEYVALAHLRSNVVCYTA
ncbi:hypothetical protein At1D132_04540 [Agrobacterium fabrum]|nr:hypothetical protein At1D132_04540 [Agrobacterium fabrum]